MAEAANMEQAQVVLDSSAVEAEKLLGSTADVSDILTQVTQRLGDIPTEFAGAMLNVPLMINMIKGYITREYTNVSPKVVASVLGSLLYLVKGKDLIPDAIPVAGFLDDFAVIALAMKLNESELEEFKAWQEDQPKPLV